MQGQDKGGHDAIVVKYENYNFVWKSFWWNADDFASIVITSDSKLLLQNLLVHKYQ